MATEEKEMSFLGHIGELRTHLIRIVIGIVVAALLIGFNIGWVVDHIFLGPTRKDFISFEVVNHFSKKFMGNESFIMPSKFQIQQKKLFEQFNVMMSMSIFGGIILSFPYIVWEIWQFIKPGLTSMERKNTTGMIAFISIFFLLGVATGYFLILPFAINFGLNYRISDQIVPLFDLTNYTSLFLQVLFGMGLVFLFPVLVLVLVRIGIINSKFLKTYRKHAIILISVVAAIITPADAISMILSMLPLLLLYEFSIILALYTEKKMAKNEVK